MCVQYITRMCTCIIRIMCVRMLYFDCDLEIRETLFLYNTICADRRWRRRLQRQRVTLSFRPKAKRRAWDRSAGELVGGGRVVGVEGRGEIIILYNNNNHHGLHSTHDTPPPPPPPTRPNNIIPTSSRSLLPITRRWDIMFRVVCAALEYYYYYLRVRIVYVVYDPESM